MTFWVETNFSVLYCQTYRRHKQLYIIDVIVIKVVIVVVVVAIAVAVAVILVVVVVSSIVVFCIDCSGKEPHRQQAWVRWGHQGA